MSNGVRSKIDGKKLYKVVLNLKKQHRAPWNNSFRYNPVGKWHKKIKSLYMCFDGYHVCTGNSLRYFADLCRAKDFSGAKSISVYEVVVSGECISEDYQYYNEEKYCVSNFKLKRKLSKKELAEFGIHSTQVG